MSSLVAKPARPWALRLLPPFPAVANRVLSLVNSDDIAAKQISEIIQLDPTFTAEILRIANSALFGVVREISTVQHAVSLLGLNRVKAMATMIALNSMVKTALRIDILKKCWKHSLVTAILTDASARVSGLGVDGAYTAGLLHNLGALGLMSAYPEEYTRMLEVSSECGFDLVQTERELFEIDHCAAGAFLAEEWNFPDVMVEAIAVHHGEPKRSSSFRNLLQVTWRLADSIGFAAFPTDKFWTYEELIELIPGASKSWLGAGLDEVTEEVASRLSSFQL